jgi:AcrR family transcriptional regulator
MQPAAAERILRAAMREFAKYGFAGARVERIVSQADVSPRSLYYHFGSKRGLYDAVRERLRSQHFDDFVRGVTEEPLIERLLANIDIAMTPRWQQWARMLMWEALDGGADKAPYPKDTTPGDLLAIRAAQMRGEIDPELDPRVLTLTFIAITFWPAMFPQSTRRVTEGMPKDDLLRARKELVRALVQRLGDRTPSIAVQELPTALLRSYPRPFARRSASAKVGSSEVASTRQSSPGSRIFSAPKMDR